MQSLVKIALVAWEFGHLVHLYSVDIYGHQNRGAPQRVCDGLSCKTPGRSKTVHFHDILSAWEGTWFASSRWQTSWLGLLGILIGIPTWSFLWISWPCDGELTVANRSMWGKDVAYIQATWRWRRNGGQICPGGLIQMRLAYPQAFHDHFWYKKMVLI